MQSRLYEVVERALQLRWSETADDILECIDLSKTGNIFDDLIELVELCDKYHEQLISLSWFKKKLVDKIYEERGEDARALINKIMKVKN